MAEINIERKKRPVWPWILLLIILALLAWALYEMLSDRDETDVEESAETGMVVPLETMPPATYHVTA
ncbi:hypothetical protein H8S95_01500 [Pontibacter sp. KCTC 32443]|uniref:hypothetical protein n=1 Tax=Pontibacter TaxID=323449 RepID=UPI00164E83A6|nr:MULTISPECIES: hypothetical protein [Pontibacter]MBC5772724.1 hypothetical protein [Pontibacter sp. KCTC 32443]